MWNWLRRRVLESDRHRLRRLERLTDDLAADVMLTSERLVRMEARLRARARKSLLASDTDDDVGGGAGTEHQHGGPLPDEPGGGSVVTELSNGSDRTVVREQLRALARAKFGGRAS